MGKGAPRDLLILYFGTIYKNFQLNKNKKVREKNLARL